jgi:SAM-dependent methyltransferase
VIKPTLKSGDSDSHEILTIFGRDVLACSQHEQRRWLNRAFVYWRSRGFPYPDVTQELLEREFRQLVAAAPASTLRRNALLPSMVGLRIANAFHPQMWHVRIHGMSAVERFGNDNVLRRVLIKALHFWPDRRCWNAQCIRSLMRVHHRIRIANFRPTAAKAIVHHFSAANGHVLDFSAGFGGRLLGSMSLHRHYVGVDPASGQARGLRRMIATFSKIAPGTAEVYQACAEDFLPTVRGRSFDLVFSSPPYFDLERYNNERTQSFKRYPRYVDWRDHFLGAVIRETRRVLRRGGYLVLNVANTPRFPIATDALRIAERELVFVRRLRLVMNAAPTARAAGRLYRHEPVFVFQKR